MIRLLQNVVTKWISWNVQEGGLRGTPILRKALNNRRYVLSKLSKINFKIFVTIQSSQDSVHFFLVGVLIEFLQKILELIKIDVAKLLGVKSRKASHRIEITLPLQRFLFFFDLDMKMNFFFNKPT
jgi:hypothetical protein